MEQNIETPSNQPQDNPPSHLEESKTEQLRTVKIKTINNQVYTLSVPPSILISEFKKEIEKLTDVPPLRQRLIYMAKSLLDEQPLSTYINDDDQTIHLLAKTQDTNAPSNPQPEAQTQGQPQGQPSQQNDLGQQQNRGFQQGGVIFRTAQIGPNMDLGNIINGLLGSVGGMGGANVVFVAGPGVIPTSNVPNQSGNNPQGANPQNQGGQGGPNIQNIPNLQQLGGPGIMGINFAISASTDPNNQNRLLINEPQIRIINPAQFPNLQGQNPSASNEQQQQNRPQQQAGNIPQQGFGGLQGLAGRNVIELPHRNVFNIGAIINSLLGQNSQFPGPPMPQLNVTRNSLVLLGGYLSAYQFQLTRLIPFLSRLGDLLQRESLIVNPNERHQVELLSHAIGRALDEVAQATTPIVNLLQNVHVGNNSGEARLTDRNRNLAQQPQNVQNLQNLGNLQGMQQQQQQQRPSGSQLQNIGQILSGGMNPQVQQRVEGSPGPSQGQQQQQQGNRDDRDRMEIVDETELFVRQQQGRVGTTEQQPHVHSAQCAHGHHHHNHPHPHTHSHPHAHGQPQTNQQGRAQQGEGGNPMSQMMGQMMSMGPGLMTQPLSAIFGEGQMMSEDAEQLMRVFGSLTMGDMFGLMTAGNTSFFDRIHPNMKETVGSMLEQNGENREELAKSWAKSFSQYFAPDEANQGKVMEGFEPQTVAEEICSKHFAGFIDDILKDYLPPHKFSDTVVKDFKVFVKELFSEISEGLYNGINDLESILKAKVMQTLSGAAGGMEGMLVGMVWPQLWQRIMRVYQQGEENTVADVGRIEEMGGEGEELLMKEIQEILTEDDKAEDIGGYPAFSEAYLKGDMNYEDKKQ